MGAFVCSRILPGHMAFNYDISFRSSVSQIPCVQDFDGCEECWSGSSKNVSNWVYLMFMMVWLRNEEFRRTETAACQEHTLQVGVLVLALSTCLAVLSPHSQCHPASQGEVGSTSRGVCTNSLVVSLQTYLFVELCAACISVCGLVGAACQPRPRECTVESQGCCEHHWVLGISVSV